jgi:hypothetical protein
MDVALQAYFFDGVNDHIRVPNDPILNFTDGITVSLFAQPQILGDKERFMISHGSWQNRWKLSITPDRKVSWTIISATGQVKDIDSETVLQQDSFYHIAGAYNGKIMMLYINGRLESFATFSGDLNASPVDLEIGQIMPDDPSYNFRGVMDEIKIYDFALLPDSVAAESGMVITAVDDLSSSKLEWSVYPVPASKYITIEIPELNNLNLSGITISIFDVAGNQEMKTSFGESPVKTMDISTLHPGVHLIRMTYPGFSFVKKIAINQ